MSDVPRKGARFPVDRPYQDEQSKQIVTSGGKLTFRQFDRQHEREREKSYSRTMLERDKVVCV